MHVWAPQCSDPSPADPGVTVHRLPDHFGPRGMVTLDHALRQFPEPCRVLIQYVSHSYGWKAMNLPFCLWLALRQRGEFWVMFHEVAAPVGRAFSLRHNVLGYTTRFMAKIVAGAAQRAFVSTPKWELLLRQFNPEIDNVTWLPVPSNVPTEADPNVVKELGALFRHGPQDKLVGHFGTFGVHIAPMLREILPSLLLAEEGRVGLLVGPGGLEFVAGLIEEHSGLQGRLHAVGAIPAASVSAHLSACDLLVQPYSDGASTRRTSLMAGLALGLPIITTDGSATEPIWQESQATKLVPASSFMNIVEAADELLADAQERNALRMRAVETYNALFSIEHVVERLRER